MIYWGIRREDETVEEEADGTSEARASGRPTMMDVARAAGVSQSSVSLVLNGMTGARISDATRQRVVAAARDLGYVLPFMRRGVPQGAPGHNIAYLADEISTTVFPVQNIDGARDAAWESGFLVSTHATRSNAHLEATTIESIRRNPGLIGVIYATIFTREVRLPASLEGVPVVLLNCYTADRRHVSVLPGEVVGGFNATSHLIKHGHRRIGLINGEPWMDASAERLVGYRQALATADLPFDPDLVLDGDWLPGTGREHFLTLMSRPSPPTAIFCGNDMMAMGALQAAADIGRRVPDDISVIGYDDQVVAGYTQPPLTTVVLPNYEMGRKAAELLIDVAVHGKEPHATLIKIDCPVIVRGSVGPAPAAAT
jgi:LacI family transcriptional regulator